MSITAHAIATWVVAHQEALQTALANAAVTARRIGVVGDTGTTAGALSEDAWLSLSLELTTLLAEQPDAPTCDREASDGNRDDPTMYYCGFPRNHAGDCGAWQS